MEIYAAFSAGTDAVWQDGATVITGSSQLHTGRDKAAYDRLYQFFASRRWTGETSSNGNHAHTLSNNVLGKSTTVQPPSMKVRVKTRYK